MHALALAPDLSDAVGAPDDRTAAVDHTAAVYRYAVRHGGLRSASGVAAALGLRLPDVLEAVDLLLESKLLRAEPDGPDGALQAVDPQVAAAVLVSPMEREIYQRREQIAQIQSRTEAFRQEYAGAGRAPAQRAAVEDVRSAQELRGCLLVAGDACREDLLVLLCGREGPDEVEALRQLCLRLRDREVAVRIVCQHRTRADLVLRPTIRRLTDAGAEVRTVSHVPRAAVVFDRSLALLVGPNRTGAATGVRVQHGPVVDFLMAGFDHLWDVATPLDPADTGCADVADDLLHTIAGLMAKGFTDEVLARKLDMSVRTCRRHIATLMHDLDAVSRFQAGVQAAQRSVLAP